MPLTAKLPRGRYQWLLREVSLKWPVRILHVLFLMALTAHQACLEDRVHELQNAWASEHPVRMR